MYGEEQRCIHGFGGETCKQEAARKGETELCENIVIVDLQGKGREMDWTDRAQDKDKCRCLVKAVIHFLFPQNAVIC